MCPRLSLTIKGRFYFSFFPICCTDALDKWPVFTKSISSGLIGLLGDLLAQSLEWGLASGPAPWNDTRVRARAVFR